ncbi:Uncharacterised protein [Mycobacterium tuberculosis]|uniref:Uncharacterized protein n=1 Tax=Mycobacterium tuberculosis TaxID=1773 RepID=A0A0T9G656_MYCTX|nr:Uncharacterised protein [Mycobacterium tuberculosis]CKT82247.1 Uncharacterised protein [Mycobacterium tuberculosis]CKW69043.1 Uncharacterised protein [Mycobacterium tuberculosis]CNL72885.1 Uncharacterised protein [Mycobacterium tuberculosis]CNM08900.1 Uncharacterised protein [Mycobacterium tuberculosis]
MPGRALRQCAGPPPPRHAPRPTHSARIAVSGPPVHTSDIPHRASRRLAAIADPCTTGNERSPGSARRPARGCTRAAAPAPAPAPRTAALSARRAARWTVAVRCGRPGLARRRIRCRRGQPREESVHAPPAGVQPRRAPSRYAPARGPRPCGRSRRSALRTAPDAPAASPPHGRADRVPAAQPGSRRRRPRP